MVDKGGWLCIIYEKYQIADVNMITIQKQYLDKLKSASKVVVGLSGGVDSIVVLDVLVNAGIKNIVAAHVNHGISSNADNWQNFCERRAKEYGVEFVVKKVCLKNSPNLEEEARKVRYDFFSQLVDSNGYLVTGHHMNDQAETFLLRALRGAGVDGLGSMRAERKLSQGTLMRPFLEYMKSDMKKYALNNNLDWVEDESNMSCDYDRNLIRNKVIPLLKEINPNAVKMLSKSASLAQGASDTIDEYVENILDGNLKGRGLKLNSDFYSLKRKDQILCLRKLLRDNGVQSISEDKWNTFIDSLNARLNSKNPNDQKIELNLSEHLKLRVLNGEIIFSSGDEKITVSYTGSGLSTRARKNGDRFFYRGRERKLKDVMAMMSIPNWQRENMPIVVDERTDMVVAVGYCIHPDFTTRVSGLSYSYQSCHKELTEQWGFDSILKTKER